MKAKKQSQTMGLILLFTVFVAWQGAKTPPPESSKILKQVMDEYWQYKSQESLYLRMKHGLKIEKLPEPTLEKEKQHAAFARKLLQKLQAVKETEINHDEFLSLGILKWELGNAEKWPNFIRFSFPITPYSSPIPFINRFFTMFKLQNEQDLETYLLLLRDYPRFITDILDLLKYQYQEKCLVPRPELQQILLYLESVILEGKKNQLYVRPDRLVKFPGEKINTFQKKVLDVIEKEINPTLRKLHQFIKGDYFKHASDKVGLWQYAGGKEYYRFLVKVHTSLDLTPEEVHQIGLREVERLDGELGKIMKQVNFKGDQQAFLKLLKTDPGFKPKTPEEIGEKLMFFNQQAAAKLGQYFSAKPQAPCGVKRLDPTLEASMTFGYYQEPLPNNPTGYYMYNGSKLEERSLLDAASLILHELVPGHHFQVSLQAENKELPDFRKNDFHTAYIEGWAEYAAQLGEEMGIYNDPYDRCGLIMQDMMMAVRLVVDTGMNYYGWSRDKATQYMRQHLLQSDTEIATETLRYAVDVPGQALGYKIGSLTMWKLRKKAEQALGDKFDIRSFHDALLAPASMPLSLVEQHIDWFITRGKACK